MSAKTPTDGGEAPSWKYTDDGEWLVVDSERDGPPIEDVNGHIETDEWLAGFDVDAEATAIESHDGYTPIVRLALTSGKYHRMELDVGPEEARALAAALEDAADRAEAAVDAEAQHADRYGPADVDEE